MKKTTWGAAGGILAIVAIIIMVPLKVLPISKLRALLPAMVVPISTPQPLASVDCQSQPTPFPTNGLSVKNYGAKGDKITDDTAAIQAAIVDAAAKGQPVVIPAGTYMINALVGIKPLTGSRIYLLNGAILKAIGNSAVNTYAVVKIANVSDVAIVGGTITGERNEHMVSGGQSGMGISVNAASHIYIKNVTMKDGWGDGLFISGGSDLNACYDVMVNNRRNNISIVGGDGIIIKNVNLINAHGTAPEAGIDIEPDHNRSVHNVVVSDSISSGNHGDAMAIYGIADPIDNVTLRNNILVNSGGMGIRAQYASNVVLQNNTVYNSNNNKGLYNYDIFVSHSKNTTVSGNTVSGLNNIIMGLLIANDATASAATNNCLQSGKTLYVGSGNTNTNNNTSCQTAPPVFKLLDLTAPHIVLTNGSHVSVAVGSVFSDPGATATDARDGSVAVTTSGTVDITTIGKYLVTYTARDSVGNTQIVGRTVSVVPATADTIPPIVTINGTNPAVITVGNTFVDLGATATDAHDGTIVVTTSGTVDETKIGTYTLTYKASDKSGNTTVATRTVTVIAAAVNKTPPAITLIGTGTISIPTGTAFTDPGATAKDIKGVSLAVIKSGTVNTGQPGTYTIRYTAVDQSKNTASVIRTVKVLAVADTVAPVVTLVGATTVNVAVGDTFTDPGATATDAHDGTIAVTTSGTVNTAVAGTYSVTYTAVDASGNTGRTARTVIVSTDTDVPIRGPVTIVPNYNVSLFVSGIPGFAQSSVVYDTVKGTHTAFSGSVQVAPTWMQDMAPQKGFELSLLKNDTVVACHLVTASQWNSIPFTFTFNTMSFAAGDWIAVHVLFPGSCPVTLLQ